MRVGVGFWGGMGIRELVDCARLAERAGLDSVWMAEGHGGDAFSILSGCALATEKIKLGTSIVSVFVRSAPTIALGAATVDALSRGRFILGLGSSHKVQVEPEHGLVYRSPMQRLRETVEVVRRLLREGKISFRGEIYPQIEYDLWFPTERREIPVYVSAVFPKMLELGGQVADGVILVWNSVEQAARSAQTARGAAARSGRNPSDVVVACLIPTCVSDDAEAAVDGMRQLVAFYAGFFPRYNRLVRESGFEREADAIREAFRAGRREEAAAHASERLVKALAIAGTPEECRRRVEDYARAGVDLPILFPTAPAARAGRAVDVRSAVADAIKAVSS